MTDNPDTCTPPEDVKALMRFYECADDNQDVDIGMPAIDRLVAQGWLEEVGRGRWQISETGMGVLGL